MKIVVKNSNIVFSKTVFIGNLLTNLDYSIEYDESYLDNADTPEAKIIPSDTYKVYEVNVSKFNGMDLYVWSDNQANTTGRAYRSFAFFDESNSWILGSSHGSTILNTTIMVPSNAKTLMISYSLGKGQATEWYLSNKPHV